jgi:hypothetical protein
MSTVERLEARIAALQAEIAALKSGAAPAPVAKASRAAGVGPIPLSKAEREADPEWRAFRKRFPRLVSFFEQLAPGYERLCLEKRARETEARRELEKLAAEQREQLAALEKEFDARLEAFAKTPIPPPMLRRAEPAPDAAYDEIASALEKAARAATDERFAQGGYPGLPSPEMPMGGLPNGFVPPPEAFARNR